MANPDNLCGRTLGEFVLRELIGAGGFGAVYRGDQPALGRRVVVKVLHQRLHGDDEALQRFKREALLASRLDHPYAAHIYASGVEADEGLVWIAMEFVDGVTLNRWLQMNGPLPLEEFVSWFDRVAEVLQAVHEQGIVHRDVKPANVMVIERAGRLLPKLLDLGIAKLVDDVAPPLPLTPVSDNERPADDPGKTDVLRGPSAAQHQHSPRGLTRSSATIGSPPYMAPEQWTAPTDVGPAADRYALGVVAFEALTGRPPFRATTPREYSELHRFAVVPSLGPAFSLALDRVFGRALAKDPADRFASALDLAGALRSAVEALPRMQVRRAARQWQARDRPVELLGRGALLAELERWMSCSDASLTPVELEFVAASRAQEAERMASVKRRATWVRRIAAAAAVLMVGIVFSVFQIKAAYETRLAQQRASAARQVAEATATAAKLEQGRQALLHGEMPDARLHLGEAYRRGDHSPTTEFMFARALEPLRAEQARFPAMSGRMWSAILSPDERQVVTTDDTAARVWNAATGQLVTTLATGGAVYGAVYAGDLLVTVSDRAVRVWDSAGALLRELHAERRDGRPLDYYRLAVAGGRVAAIDATGAETHVWDLTSGALLARLPSVAAKFPRLAFSADCRWLAVTGGDDVRIWDTSTWTQATRIRGPQTRGLAFAPTQAELLVGTAIGDAAIWAAPTGVRLHHLRELGEAIDAVAWSPDGRLVAVGAHEGAEQVWDAQSGVLQAQANYLHGRVQAVEFDARSQLLVAAGSSGAIAVAEVSLGLPIAMLDGPAGVVRSVHFDARGRRVLAAVADGTARIWAATAPYRRWSSPPFAGRCDIVGGVEPDGRFVAVPCLGYPTRIWDTARDELLAELPAIAEVGGAPVYPAVSAGGDRAAIARGAMAVIHALPGGNVVRRTEHQAPVTAIAFGPDGALVSADAAGRMLLTRDDAEPSSLRGGTAPVDAALWLSDGRIISADAERQLRVYDAHGTVVAALEMPIRARMLRVSADGRRLVTVPSNVEATPPSLWDIEHYRRLNELAGHVGPVFSVRFVGDQILSTGGDGMVLLWSGTTGRLTQTFRGNGRYLADAELDGELVIAGGDDGLLRFWDVASANLLWTIPAHTSHLVGVHRQGRDLITRAFTGDIARWTLPVPRDVIRACGAREATGRDDMRCGNVAP